MPSINILCSSALPFVPGKFQIDAEEHDTVLVVKKRLCSKLVQLQREGSLETTTEAYNREQEHLADHANLKLIFGGKILPDTSQLPGLVASNPTFHLHLLPLGLDKKISIIERFGRGSSGRSEAIAAVLGHAAAGGAAASSFAPSGTYTVRLLSNQSLPTVHYNIQPQSLYNLDGEKTLADLKELIITALGNDTPVKSLEMSIQRKFVVFNSKGEDFSDDTMKVKDINNFGRPPHSQGTNIVIFYRFVMGEFEHYQIEEESQSPPQTVQSNNPFKQAAMDTSEPSRQCSHNLGTASPPAAPSNSLAGAFTAQLNFDDDKGKEVDTEQTLPVETSSTHEEAAAVSATPDPAPTPTIKHMFIKDPNLGNFHLNPNDVRTGSSADSEWIAFAPREFCRLKRMYREFGNDMVEEEVKRRKSGEFTRSAGAFTSSRDQGHSSPSAFGSSSSSLEPSSGSAASSAAAHHAPVPAHGHIHTPPVETANSTDTEPERATSSQAVNSAHALHNHDANHATHTTDHPAPPSDQYRQFQQFLRWADTQHEDHTEPAEFDYRQFQQFLQWGQVQPPTQPPLLDVSFRFRVSAPPWNLRQRFRDMIPPREQLRQNAVAVIHQVGNALVFLCQLFVFYIIVLGRINNDYVFYASCALTVIILVGYRFRHHLERFRPAGFHVGSEELSRVAHVFPAVNYDQEDNPVNGDDEDVRQALENRDDRQARGVRIGAAFFGSMVPAVHSQWLADNRQRRVQLDASIRQRAIEREDQGGQTGAAAEDEQRDQNE